MKSPRQLLLAAGIAVLAAFALHSSPLRAQAIPAAMNPLDCAPSTPCTLSGPFNTGTGDNYATGAAKTNINLIALFDAFGSGAHLATAGTVIYSDITGLWGSCTSSPSTLVLYGDGTCRTTLSTLPAFTGPVTTSAGSTATLLNLTTGGITGPLGISLGGTGTATPGLIAGTNVTITGSWPNQTISSTGGGGGGGSGTVTSVSVATANGLTGSVANPTTTPALTLAPTFTGIGYSNGSAFSALTIGSNLTLSGSTLNGVGPGGSTGQIQYNNAGAFGGLSTTGTGSVVESIGPSLVTPALGAATATSLVVGSPTGGSEGTGTINATGVYVNGVAVGTGGGNVASSGTPTNGQIAQWTNATTIQGVGLNGSGAPVGTTSAALVTPNLGTPSAVTLTNGTGLPTTGLTGTLQAAQEPAFTGDVSKSAGSLATTVVKVNGLAVPASQACVGTNSSSQFVTASCGPPTFQVNASNLASATTVNYENSAATGGLTLTFANPSAGNVQLGLTGWPGTLVSGDCLTNNGTTISWASCAGSAGSFASLSSGTNTAMAGVVGSGASLNPAGTGVINANEINAGTVPVSTPLLASNGSGALVAATYTVRSVSGTSDSILTTDCSNAVSYSSSSAVAITLAQATGSFASCSFDVQNTGTGTDTITPTTSTINGASTLALPAKTSCTITAQSGNYSVVSCDALLPTGGTLSASGTPTAHQLGVWVTSTTLEGVGPGTSGLPFISGGASADGAFGALGLSGLATQAANTIVANATGSTAAPTAYSVGSERIAWMAANTKFTAAGTGCTVGTTTGGPFGGTFTLATGPCTQVVITMNGATGFTDAVGYACAVNDQTALAAGTYIPAWGQKSSTGTTATIPIPSAAGTTDVISFYCHPVSI